MAAGKPIAASDISCFAEVGGAALLCFPVGDASAAAEVIETVWSDDAARASLIAAGTERRCLFTVDHLADQIAALYAKILAKPASAAARE